MLKASDSYETLYVHLYLNCTHSVVTDSITTLRPTFIYMVLGVILAPIKTT